MGCSTTEKKKAEHCTVQISYNKINMMHGHMNIKLVEYRYALQTILQSGTSKVSVTEQGNKLPFVYNLSLFCICGFIIRMQ